jgi:5-methylcytosine-specific restriction protein A
MVHSGVMERRCCELCGRAIPQLTRHHLIPRIVHRRPRTRRNFTRDERLMVILLCRACHKQIHNLFTESELNAHLLLDRNARGAPEVARFIEWVARQPPTVDVRVRRRRH